jgi:hypothetical protein
VVNPGFTADQVATWLEQSNCRRARWVYWPDPQALATDLATIDFTDWFVPHHVTVRQVRQITGALRRLADAWDRTTLSRDAWGVLAYGAGSALSAAHPDDEQRDLAEMAIADGKAIWSVWADAAKFPNFLQQIADGAEWQLAQDPAGNTHDDHLSFFYGLTAKTLERHTGSPPTIRAVSPDARFCRDVLEHARVPWQARRWRRCAEEWAAVRRGEIDQVRLVSRLAPANRAESPQEK